jgi:hypothetical protein
VRGRLQRHEGPRLLLRTFSRTNAADRRALDKTPHGSGLLVAISGRGFRPVGLVRVRAACPGSDQRATGRNSKAVVGLNLADVSPAWNSPELTSSLSVGCPAANFNFDISIQKTFGLDVDSK